MMMVRLNKIQQLMMAFLYYGVAIDVVVSMDTATMTTTEGGEAMVCANLDSPSGGTSVPITVVFTWSGGV